MSIDSDRVEENAERAAEVAAEVVETATETVVEQAQEAVEAANERAEQAEAVAEAITDAAVQTRVWEMTEERFNELWTRLNSLSGSVDDLQMLRSQLETLQADWTTFLASQTPTTVVTTESPPPPSQTSQETELVPSIADLTETPLVEIAPESVPVASANRPRRIKL